MHDGKAGSSGQDAQDELNGQEQPWVEQVLAALRDHPEAWLPDPEDHSAWTEAAQEASEEAARLGVDLSALAAEAERQALEEVGWLGSRPASRAGLGEYLRRCREIRRLSPQELAAHVTAFSTQEIFCAEGGTVSIYKLLETREKTLAKWLTAVEANPRRVVRLLENCPWPPEWQNTPSEVTMTYQPASAEKPNAGGELPPRARDVIKRLLAALAEA